jgi:hypothetical protein
MEVKIFLVSWARSLWSRFDSPKKVYLLLNFK